MGENWRGGILTSGGRLAGSGTVETGILRKNKKFVPDKFEDLLVFGYQCKIIRDDEKAWTIDQGRHLIPWMGDPSLKIDRYDVRATLSDLTLHEAPPGGYQDRLEGLAPAEQKAEQLCEEERYYSLYHNEIEEEAYQEEEQKRQKGSHGQVGFNYDTPKENNEKEDTDSNGDAEQDEAFTPPPNFYIPPDMELPETVKLNAIIEKTAKFIMEQGMQMEILIKTKQANNPQFEFLNHNGRLNQYYKFIMNAMKLGTYPERAESPKESTETSETDSVQPKVEANTINTPMPIVPVLKYVPSADCAYTQLISKIKGTPIPSKEDLEKEEEKQEEVQEIEATEVVAPKEVIDFKMKSGSVEVKKISTGLMLAQCYNSDSEEENEDENGDDEMLPKPESSLSKLDLPIPPESLRHIIDKTAAYVAKNGKDFENILKTKSDSRFDFLDSSSEFHRYYVYKVTGTIYLPSTKEETSNGTKNGKEKPKIVQPVSFSIKPAKKEDPSVPQTDVPMKLGSQEDDEDEENGIRSELDEAYSRDVINVAELLELEEKKEIKRAEERVRDKLAAAAREKLGLISKEKQLQLERKKKAMAFLSQIKGANNVDSGSAVKEADKQSSPADAFVSSSSRNLERKRSRSKSRSSSGSSSRSRSKSQSRSRSHHKKHKRSSSPQRRDRDHRKKSKRRSRSSSRSPIDRKYKRTDRNYDDRHYR